MLLEQIRSGGCLSYLVACEATRVGLVVDPELDQLERTLALIASTGVRVRYVMDTHTHADHFSAVALLARRLDVPAVGHRSSVAPFLDLRVEDGDTLLVGDLRVAVLHTPGHTSDSMSLHVEDRVLTGDALLIGGTGRTDLPTGDPAALHESLFGRLLRLDDATRVYPAHDYKQRAQAVTTIGAERAENPRLKHHERTAFVAQMQALDLAMPKHLTEALRTNRSGGMTVKQLIADAARQIPFMSMRELSDRVARRDPELVVVDVRERDAYLAGHVPGARHIPRGQLELRLDSELPDPTVRVACVCQVGKISTLAAATLRQLGFGRAVALDGGMEAWQAAGHPLERGA